MNATTQGKISTLDWEDFQHLIPIVIDDLYRDLPGRRLGEWSAGRAVEARPGVFVDFGTERPLELVVRLAAASEIGVANEEALAIVISVDEPGGNVVVEVAGRRGPDRPGRGVVDIQPDDTGASTTTLPPGSSTLITMARASSFATPISLAAASRTTSSSGRSVPKSTKTPGRASTARPADHSPNRRPGRSR